MSFFWIGGAVLLACAWGVWALFGHLERRLAAVLSAGLLAGVLGVPGVLFALSGDPRPREVKASSYETSTRCVKCHPDHFRTWSHTYHRTMTQDASPEAILGDFDDARVRYNGHDARFTHEGDRFYMEVVDHVWEERFAPKAGPAEYAPRRRYPIDRLVGSHHEQVYLSLLDNGEYFVLPFVWNQTDAAWRPLGAIFLNEEWETVHPGYGGRWNASCMFCHNTRPNPGMLPGSRPGDASWDVHVAELGIACEACHGPAEVHSATNQNLVRRQLLIESGRRDRTIVNAARLSKQRSVNSCGRCHGKWRPQSALTRQVLEQGELFVPGQKKIEALFEAPMVTPEQYDPALHADYFWPDATPRATALEYQGVLISPCFERGDMTCLSCHSMHAADPSDQLRFAEDPETPEHESDMQCVQCHPDFEGERALVAHTGHEADSAGSRCVACHMPYQSWGLMLAQRSHRVQSPDPVKSALHGLPNGCNQCHVDRSLRWTAETLAEWASPAAPPEEQAHLFSGDRANHSETLLQLATGHALSRGIAAQMLGRAEGHEAAAGHWRAPFLIDALDDPYAVVRQVAFRSLRTLPGFEDASFTYYADAAQRAQEVAALRARWRAVAREHAGQSPPGVPMAPGGAPDARLMSRWRASRDDMVLNIVE